MCAMDKIFHPADEGAEGEGHSTCELHRGRPAPSSAAKKLLKEVEVEVDSTYPAECARENKI